MTGKKQHVWKDNNMHNVFLPVWFVWFLAHLLCWENLIKSPCSPSGITAQRGQMIGRHADFKCSNSTRSYNPSLLPWCNGLIMARCNTEDSSWAHSPRAAYQSISHAFCCVSVHIRDEAHCNPLQTYKLDTRTEKDEFQICVCLTD